jgi:hypothetical protein
MSKSKIVSFEKPNLAVLERIRASGHLRNHEKRALKSYMEKIDNKTGLVKVDYKVEQFGRHKNEAVKGKSRTTFTGTLMRRDIRNLAFGELYDDLDIANASACVMRKLFAENGLPTEHLSYYIDNREEVLQLLMDELGIYRRTAKDIFIEIFFCGSGKANMYGELNPYKHYKLPSFVERLKDEYNTNLEHLVDNPEYADIRNFCVANSEKKGKEAWIGTFASFLYQDEERKIIEVIYNDIVEIGKKRKIDNPTGAIIFDGLHILKTLNIRNCIEKIEATVLSKTGYKIKLEIKEMEVDAEEKAKLLGDEKVELSYEARKTEFEKTRFKTKNGRKLFHTVNSYWNDDIPELSSVDKSQFSTQNEDLFEGALLFLASWFLDPEKRSYDDIEYSCVSEEQKQRQKNIYYAFPVLRYTTLESVSTPEQRQKHIDWLNDYLLMLVEDNELFLEWIRFWVADLIQNPHTKGANPIACLFLGKEGCGKSFLTLLIKAIFGDSIVWQTETPTANGDILHEFNSALKNKLFIEFQEVNMRTMGSVADQIKGFITSNEHRITHKGHDPITVKATERLVFTTNNRCSLIINKGDRRNACFEVSNRFLGDEVYWNDAHAKLKDNNFIKDITDYLLGIDLTGYNFRDRRPKTKYYKSLIQFSMPTELNFFREKLFYGNTDLEEFKSGDGHYTFPSSRLFDLFSMWRKEVFKAKDETTQTAWTLRMKNFNEYGIVHRHLVSSNAFVLDIDTFKQKVFEDFDVELDEHSRLTEL